MSSAIIPGVRDLAGLLARLRDTAREFAAKEEAISKNWRNQSATETKTLEAGAQNLSARLAEEAASVEARFSAGRDKIQAKFEARQSRIELAHRSSRKRASEAISDREGRIKYHLQKRALDAGRKRDSDLAAAASRLERFRAQLEESRQKFGALEFAAQKAFRPAGEFRKMLELTALSSDAGESLDEDQLLAELTKLQDQTQASLRRFKRNVLLGLFRLLPLWLFLSLALLVYPVVIYVLPRYGFGAIPPTQVGLAVGGAVVGLLFLFLLGKQIGRPTARGIANALLQARHGHDLALQKAERRLQQDQDRTKGDWENANQQFNEQWQQALNEAEHARSILPARMDEKKARAVRKNGDWLRRSRERLDRVQVSESASLRQRLEANEQALVHDRDAKLATLQKEVDFRREALVKNWQDRVHPIWSALTAGKQTAETLFPGWENAVWESWLPPREFEPGVRFGDVEVNVEKLADVRFAGKGLAFPGPTVFDAPLLLNYPAQGSLLFETGSTGSEEAVGAMNSIIFRLLAASPPGRVNLTIIDPVGLGQSFAGLMHLADYEDNPINGRIWTQTAQIEERLAELNEHMEKVIQMYLRNEFPTIAEYNAHAGVAAEKYHVVVIASFPVNFSETAARRLLNIAASGARCGVYLVIHWDQRHALPADFVPDELRKNCIRLLHDETGWRLAQSDLTGLRLRLDAPPPPRFVTEFLRKVGQGAKDSNRVELPFSQVAPPEDQRWSEETSDEVRVPIGRTGAARWQYLAIGRGTRQHGLIAGKTGSGKSNLFHVIITNLGLWCSPDEVEFYLVDFKKGVEFKCYASRQLPHARVVAIESDREFGLSVLQRVDDELRRRGDLFRKLGVQEFASFRKATAGEPLPRLLLVIDEFQEFFTEEDRVSQTAAVLLDRIVRQGRAFGIHVLLGSQTLGGAYTLARATMGQMVIRIALQCNEADAYLIMDENNAAPRLLSRPGEGIYNDMAGALEGNSPFQAVFFPDEIRDQYLIEIRNLADREPKPQPGPIVFEGNSPADISQNELLRRALSSGVKQAPTAGRVWLGAPNSIKGPTEVVFQKQSGNHLLVVGQNDEAALTMVAASLVSIAAQYPPEAVRIVLLESTAPGSPEREFIDRVVLATSRQVIRPKRPELGSLLSELANEVKRHSGEEEPAHPHTTFVIIAGLQEFKQLRQEDDFAFSASDAENAPSPGASLSTLISEGATAGFHVIATVDTYNNVSRFLGRKGLSEFQMRVLFQMSPSDSASLIDNPDAAKLGLHRALLYNEREGYSEKFRPYALPSNAWIEEVARLCQRAA